MAATEAIAEDTAEAPAPKTRRKLGPLIMIAVFLLAAGGGGAWWFLGRSHAPKEAKAAPEKEVPPIYLPLDSFTVNLQPEGGDQFLQVALSLKVADEATVEALKARLPEVRNRILLLLSSKRPSELSSTEGKEKLGRDIRLAVARTLSPGAPEKVAAEPAAKAASGNDAAAAAPDAAAPAAEATAGDTAAKAASPAGEADSAPAKDADATPAPPPAPSPIIGVMFTSFIVQ